MLAHVQFDVHQDPFCKAPFLQSYFPAGWPPDLTCTCSYFSMSVRLFCHTFLKVQIVQNSLRNSTTIWYISHSSQFYIICKLAEGAPCPIIQIISGEFKQYFSQYSTRRYSTIDWPSAGLCATGDNPLRLVTQPAFKLSHCPLPRPCLSVYLWGCYWTRF